MRRIKCVVAGALMLAGVSAASAGEYDGAFCYSESAVAKLAHTYATYGYFTNHYKSRFENLTNRQECYANYDNEFFTLFVVKRGEIVHGNAGVWQVVGYAAAPEGPPILFGLLRTQEPFAGVTIHDS